jgi:hypothetical protein
VSVFILFALASLIVFSAFDALKCCQDLGECTGPSADSSGGGPGGGGTPVPTPTWTWQQKVDYWAAHQHDLDYLNPTPNDPGSVPPDVAAATGVTTWDQLYWWAKSHAANISSAPKIDVPTANQQIGPYQIAVTPVVPGLPTGFPADAPGSPIEQSPPPPETPIPDDPSATPDGQTP